MLYVGEDAIPVTNTAAKVQKKGYWLYASADATVTVTFAAKGATEKTLFPLVKGVTLPIEILEVSQASAAGVVWAVKPKG